MSNVHRLRTTDWIFFVTVNLRRGIRHFSQDEFPLLIRALSASRKRVPFLVCAYVLMPDHCHALIGVREPVTISRAMQDVKWLAARLINRHRGTRGAIWQRQFWDRFVRDAKELTERINYMHLNPVRRGLAARPEDWRWSSCNNYALEKFTVANCPMQVDYVRLPESYRG